MQELGLDQLVHRARRRLAVHARDRRGVLEGRVVAEDRQRPCDGPDRRRAATEPGGHEAGHRRRPEGGDRIGAEAGGSPPRSSRAVISWRTSSGFPAVVRAHSAQTASVVAAPRLPRTRLGDGRGAERRRAHGRRRLPLGQLGQRIRGRRGLARPHRDDRARRDLFDPRPQVDEKPDRLRVRPVRVVDEQGERALLGQPRAQPVQTVEAREQPVVRGRPVGDLLEQRSRESGGARERAFTTRDGRAARRTAPAAGSPRRARTPAPSPLRARGARPSPLPAASAAASPINELLPIPGAPSITRMPPAPAAAAWSAAPICSSSASRSNRWVRRPSSAIRLSVRSRESLRWGPRSEASSARP